MVASDHHNRKDHKHWCPHKVDQGNPYSPTFSKLSSLRNNHFANLPARPLDWTNREGTGGDRASDHPLRQSSGVIAIYKFGGFPMFRSMSEDRRKRRAPQADPHDREASA
jgi:hypothetical protein